MRVLGIFGNIRDGKSHRAHKRVPLGNILLAVGLLCLSIGESKSSAQASEDRIFTDSEIQQIQRGAELKDSALRLVREGRYEEASVILTQACALIERIFSRRHRATIVCGMDRAFAIANAGRFGEAEALLVDLRHLSIDALGPDDPSSIRADNNYANLLSRLGRAEEAAPILADVLRRNRVLLGDNNMVTLRSVGNYAAILEQLGRAEEALPIFEEAYRGSILVLGETDAQSLLALHNYAAALDSVGRTQESLPLLSRVIRLRKRVLGETHPDTLTSMANFASALSALDRDDQAIAITRELLAARIDTLGFEHPDTILSLSDYAVMLANVGRYSEAVPYQEEAARLRRSILGDRHPRTLRTIGNLVQTLAVLGRSSEALPFAREIVEASRARTELLGSQGVEADAQLGRENESRRSVERQLADVHWYATLDTRPGENDLQDVFVTLQNASTRSTSLAVAQSAAARYASARGLGQLVDERDALNELWAQTDADLIELMAAGVAAGEQRDEARARITTIETRLMQIDALLARDAPRYLSILKRPAISFAQLKQLLGADEAILLMVPTEQGTHVLAATHEGIEWSLASRDTGDIAADVREFRAGLEIEAGSPFLPQFNVELAFSLYSDLIAPVEAMLAGKRRVYVVADGALSRLPLATLLTSPAPEGADPDDPDVLRGLAWLSDSYALVQMPSVQSLAHIRSFSEDGQSIDASIVYSGFGAPVLDGESTLRGARTATLDPIDARLLLGDRRNSDGLSLMNPDVLRTLSSLPGTRFELEEVRNSLGSNNSRLWLSAEMTESAIRNADLTRTRILHLATHGFTSEEAGNLAEPGLVFTPPSEATREDDGYLAASEVVRLDLAKAQWIILSACNTASPSRRAGETGLSGLAQAFFYAGAESLLVSHWPVFDDIAPVLTVETLKRSQEGEPRAEALQFAMRMIRNDPELDAAHPAVWAPFFLVGEGNE